jgi:AraC-like DNA-binding protein
MAPDGSRAFADVAAAEELSRLRRCIGDLAALLALSSPAGGREPAAIVGALLDTLVDTLDLDFACTCVAGTTQAPRIAHVRHRGGVRSLSSAVCAGIVAWLAQPSAEPFTMAVPGGELTLVPACLGLDDTACWALAASARADFPETTDRVMLGVAVNQATVALLEAQRLAGQWRVAAQLDRLVARRTGALQAANRDLAAALAQIDALKDTLQSENATLREDAAVARGGLAPWQLRAAKAMLDADSQDAVTVEGLAAACGLSVRHFARAFRQSTGVPPHRWRLRRRVDRAQDLLRDPAPSLADIALACGFGDQSHFTRVFAAVVGQSPGKWRRLRAAQDAEPPP